MKLADNNVPLEERLQRARALGADASPESLEELLAALDVMSEELHDVVVAALRQRNAGAVVLTRATDVRRPRAERVHALGGVRALKPEGAAAALAPLLDSRKERDEAVREATAHALCVVPPDAAEAALVSSLKAEPSAKVRFFVALALGELKTPAAKAAVTAALKSEKDFTVLDSLGRAQRKHNAP